MEKVSKVKDDLNFKKLFLVFLFGSILGYLWEGIYRIIRLVIASQPIEWRHYKGLIYGPFNPVYGIGAVILTLCLTRKKMPSPKIFIYAFFLGGIIEYVLSLFQELIFGTMSWNYQNQFLNIHGRTTLIYMLAWGGLGLLYVHYVYPFFNKLIKKIPSKIEKYLYVFLLVFLIFNIIISTLAVYRQSERRNNIPPRNKIEFYIDQKYNDEVLKKHFRNLKWVK